MITAPTIAASKIRDFMAGHGISREDINFLLSDLGLSLSAVGEDSCSWCGNSSKMSSKGHIQGVRREKIYYRGDEWTLCTYCMSPALGEARDIWNDRNPFRLPVETDDEYDALSREERSEYGWHLEKYNDMSAAEQFNLVDESVVINAMNESIKRTLGRKNK
jgi:hypothetical protein